MKDKFFLNPVFPFLLILLYAVIGCLFFYNRQQLVVLYPEIILCIILIIMPMMRKYSNDLLVSTKIFYEKMQRYLFIYKIALMTFLFFSLIIGYLLGYVNKFYSDNQSVRFIQGSIVAWYFLIICSVPSFIVKKIRFYIEKENSSEIQK